MAKRVPLRRGSSIRIRPRGKVEASQDNAPGGPQPRRSNEFWIAIVGVLSTLLVGITGSVVAYKVSEANNGTQLQLAQDEFMREQRQTDYRAYETAYSNFFNGALDAAAQLFRADPPASYDEVYGSLQNVYRAYIAATWNLQFSATRPVYSAALDTFDEALAIINVFDTWTPLNVVAPLPGSANQFHQDLNRRTQAIMDAHNSVVDRAREDLGLTD